MRQKLLFISEGSISFSRSRFREYKESLRLQRTVDSIYKCPTKETVTNLKSSVPTSNNMKVVVPAANDTKSNVLNANNIVQVR